MKSYEITLKLTKEYYQLVTVEDSASEDDARTEAFEEIDEFSWDFMDEDCEIVDVQEL